MTTARVPLVVRNIAANYFGKVWSAVSIYLFVPLYIKLLGIDSYGIIGFHSVLLGIALIADAGLSAAFSREMARSSDAAYLRDLLCTMERLYLSICVGVALVIVLSSHWIATRWLQLPASVPVETGTISIALMGIAVSLQLAMSLYVGGLMGMQRQESANLHQILFSAARSGLVLVPLYWFPNLIVYFSWQVLAACLFAARFRHVLWRSLQHGAAAVFRWSVVSGIYRFAIGMFGMSIIGALNTQLDKLVTSSLFPLSDYAIYSVVALLAQTPSMLTLPVALAVLPRMTQMAERRDTALLAGVYIRYATAIALIASTIGVILIAYAHEVIQLWTGNALIAARGAPLLQVLAGGGLCLALQLMPYHLSLANGHNTTNLKLGFAFLLVTPPLTIFLARRYGLIGATLPWLAMNLLAAAALGALLTRRFLPGRFAAWLLHATLAPVGLVFAAGWLCRWGVAAALPAAVPVWLPLVLALFIVPILSAGSFVLLRQPPSHDH